MSALPCGWMTTSLGEIAEPTRPRRNPQSLGGLPFIGMEHIEAHSMKLLGTVPAGTMKSAAIHFMPGDVLYGRLRPYLNKVFCTNFEGLCSAEFIVFPASEHLDSKFLQYRLNSADFVSFASHLNAGDRPRVDFEQISPYRILLPPLLEQRLIVAEIEKRFTRLGDGIDSLRRAQAGLTRYRASVLRAACEGRLAAVDEDGLTKKEPSHEHAPDRLPPGWRWVSVQEIGDVQLGRQRSPKHRAKDYPTEYLRAANITENGLDVRNVFEMEFTPSERERYRLREGDIVLSEASGSASQAGKPAIWRAELPLCCFQNTVIRFRASGVLPEYALLVFRHYYFNRVFAGVAAGVSINHVSASKFANLPFPLPPADEQRQIVEDVDYRLSEIEHTGAVINSVLDRIHALRGSVLATAFEGKLVSQDPSDEPASSLLDRLLSQRARAEKERPPARPRRRATAAAYNLKKAAAEAR